VIGIFGAGTLGTGIANFQCYWNSDSTLYFQETVQNSSNQLLWTSTPVYRDPTAWYHIVVAVDVTQATASNRLKLYVNGVAQSGSFSVTPGTTTDLSINNNVAQYIGGAPINPNAYGNILTYHDGYFAEVNFVDGQQLTPTSFGAFDATTGVWNPTAYTGSYGTNGYYLKFSDNSAATAAAIGKDSSGNGNNWTPTNISVTAGATNDSLLDSPTNYGTDTGVGGSVRGNYATLNPLANGTAAYVKDGNLRINPSDGNFQSSLATIGVSSGKWYAECTVTNVGSGFMVGIDKLPSTLVATNYLGNSSTSYGYYGDGTNARLYNNSSYTSYGATYTTGVVIGVALDMDAGTLVFYRNGTSQGTAVTGLSGTYVIGASPAGAAGIADMNYGQRLFANTAPSGFKALCTQNLPTPTIKNGADHMAATTYTGTGASLTVSNAVNGVSFQPDWVWIKGRSAATDHTLTDAVRGATKELKSNTTGAESTAVNGLTAFNSGGFSVGGAQDYNTNAATYVGWQWKGGGTAVTNTSGSISSQVSANPTAGFSIVGYTGTGANATVGHGLGVAPSMVIIKNRSTAASWMTYHASVGNTAALFLNLTNASITSSTYFNNTSPTASVFSIGDATAGNGSGNSMVAYCFAAISGYSAFGSYTGNGSGDGPFIYLGFRPRWWMHKNYGAAGDGWWVYDSVRNTYNALNFLIQANLSYAEATQTGTGIPMDFVSNGVKIRNTSGDGSINGSGSTYIYAAFAENPFSIARAR
jgi:hypothetical protein